MERLPLPLLLCLSLVPVLQAELITVDLSSISYNLPVEDGCCQPSAVITQAIGGDSSCTVQIRGCEFGCSRCSNHTGNILLGNSASDLSPVCPAEMSMEPAVCCTPAQTVKRYKYCSGTWYSYEYPVTCSCGPCEYLPTNTKCKLQEYTQKLSFWRNHQFCTTRNPITRRTCRGYCTSTEHNYFVYMQSPVPNWIPVYRKNCQCCEAATYEILQDVTIYCTIPGWNWTTTYTADIQVILTCDCEWCGTKPFGVQTVEDDTAASAEPIDITVTMAKLGISIAASIAP